MRLLETLSRLIIVVGFIVLSSYGPMPTAVAQVLTAGSAHACKSISNGPVRCWGSNSRGQLGDGTTTNALTPVTVHNIGFATAISAGQRHTCALATGSVSCWGRNSSGQLGNGSTTNALTPVTVVNLGGTATLIAAGGFHTCALLSTGSVRCWGNNLSGQLGNGTTTNSLVPVTVSKLGGVATSIVAGELHTCALLTNGSVRCWGGNPSGQLGNGTTRRLTRPGTVRNLEGVPTVIAAGQFHTCVRLMNGSVRCWGRNDKGQLGNGRTTNALTPVTVSNLGGGATLVAAGGFHTCALLSTGSIRCWGSNVSGQLGNGMMTFSATPTPVPVFSLFSSAQGIACGGSFTCAQLSDGAIACWGNNDQGQLGNGMFVGSSLPVMVNP